MRFFLLLIIVGFSFSKPILESFSQIKRFPFITYKEAWTGTPAQSREVAVPAVVITYGEKEKKELVEEAVNIAYFLGQWTEDVGITPRMVRKGKLPSLILPLSKALKTDKNLILIGTRNKIVKNLNIAFRGPTLKVISWQGRKILLVGGRNPTEIKSAARFLAYRIVGFKAGAYKTFFSFVKLRAMIEKEDFSSALNLIKDPSGLSACGKNMSLAAPMMLRFPPEVKKIVKERNIILYKKIPQALRTKDKEKAIKLWRKAMITCYRCHQGLGIKRLRRFIPNENIHSKHQKIAEDFGLLKKEGCGICHKGITEIRGY